MMRLDSLESLPEFIKKTIVAIGNFDGIHLGHQKILQYLDYQAKKLDLNSLVLTFTPHPEKILSQKRIQMIQTIEQRLEEIENYNIDFFLILPFDKRFSRLSPQNFVKKVLVHALRADEIVVGENFRFGKNREGSLSFLKTMASELNFRVYSIPPVKIKGEIVSSSRIRNFLENGEIAKANLLLGKPYEIRGEVIKGDSRGKHLGFPTANIKTENEMISSGVFVTKVRLDSRLFPALTNVGIRPTFNSQRTSVESYIIDFKEDLYGKKISLLFLKKIRDEIKFTSAEELSLQLGKDLKAARAFFKV